MKRIGQAVMVCIAAVTLACDAGTRRDDNAIGTSGVSDADADFVADAASSGMTEAKLGELAQQKAQSGEVKQFGEMMVRDHTKGGQALKQIATQHSISVPNQPKDAHNELINRLSERQGTDFDREYIDAMIDNHEQMINLLQRRASEDRFGDDKGAVRPEDSDDPVEAALNKWAADTLPTARHHLDEARRIKDAIGNRLTTREPAK